MRVKLTYGGPAIELIARIAEGKEMDLSPFLRTPGIWTIAEQSAPQKDCQDLAFSRHLPVKDEPAPPVNHLDGIFSMLIKWFTSAGITELRIDKKLIG